jgi:hypothetical protein
VGAAKYDSEADLSELFSDITPKYAYASCPISTDSQDCRELQAAVHRRAPVCITVLYSAQRGLTDSVNGTPQGYKESIFHRYVTCDLHLDDR